ncbi:hypothetical protein RD792_013192 [Penstemon davidsonii]|uniref:BHLH domain-containing protein n=1 Tax=Penstemon davidsonii TaxID=160366 RepID=A0ABR0CSS2_9LAMI|nr:hypothetical protein RD792_013192 [Penstemon davidsonii]
MFNSIPSLYELGSGFSDSYNILQDVLLNSPTDSPRSMAEAKAMAASNSHKEAERRRRKRINDHIATLKSILPNSIKTDKASLLGEAVRRVRELKKIASELSATYDDDNNNNDDDIVSSNTRLKPIMMFPTETDELKLEVLEDSGLIKVTMCCEDRPEIIYDLIQALKSSKAKVVKAEMSTVGGRTKNVLWVKIIQLADVNVVGSESDVGLGTLRRALKIVMDKSTLLAGSDQGLPGHKRPRYYHF